MALCYIPVLKSKIKNSQIKVLHISYPVHTAYQTVDLLKKNGVYASYLAIGKITHWDKFDKHFEFKPFFLHEILNEVKMLFYIRKFNILHCHFALIPCKGKWMHQYLKRSDIRIVVHHRGCSSRDPNINSILQPQKIHNICSDCDYENKTCQNKFRKDLHTRLESIAHYEIATTPDLIDFKPKAKHIPFYSTDIKGISPKDSSSFSTNKLKIMHWTNHPGIEGTLVIKEIINELVNEGLDIQLDIFMNEPHKKILKLIPQYDLTIGKMKMGYYANSQIESLGLGVPAITYIRDEYLIGMNSERLPFFNTDLSNLKTKIKNIYFNPGTIKEKVSISKDFLNTYHNNSNITKKLISIYYSCLNNDRQN